MLRFPLAVMIVVMHVLSMPADGGRVSAFINGFMYGFISEYAVAIYFFIAGYVFFYNIAEFGRETYFCKLRKRMKTIVVPYLIWNTIAIILAVCKKTAAGYLWSDAGGSASLQFSVVNILKCYWNYDGMLTNNPSFNYGTPLDSPLWFLRSLMILTLLSPLLYRVLKSGFGAVFVALAGGLWLAARPCEPTCAADYMLYQFVWSVFFFSWGGVMSIRRIGTGNIFRMRFDVSALLYVVSGLLSAMLVSAHPTIGALVKGLSMIAGVVFAFNLADMAVRRGYRAGPEIIEAGIFIYMSHILFSGALFDSLSLILPPTSECAMFAVKLLTVILLCGSLTVMYYLLRRYMPGLLKVVIGR